MTGSERRDKIIATMQENRMPVPGKELASFYNVSRQVIVQDIALMRAAGYDIISTNRGYILNSPKSVKRIFKGQTGTQMNRWKMNSIQLWIWEVAWRRLL